MAGDNAIFANGFETNPAQSNPKNIFISGHSLLVNQVCASYYNIQGIPEQTNICIQGMNNTSTFLYNPFNWPDPDITIWPAPD